LKKEGKTIIKSGKYTTGHQRYYCHSCESYFMETKGTAFYRKKLSVNEINKIIILLLEGRGIRSIEKRTGHHRDTVGNLIESFAENAEQMNTYLQKNSGFTFLEAQKFWNTISTTRKKFNVKARLALKRVL
jgi:transposase-like protein